MRGVAPSVLDQIADFYRTLDDLPPAIERISVHPNELAEFLARFPRGEQSALGAVNPLGSLLSIPVVTDPEAPLNVVRVRRDGEDCDYPLRAEARRASLRARFGDWLTAATSHGGRLHRLWWKSSDRSMLALHMWRPVCWLRGYHVPHHVDVYFENCVTCWKPLWSRSRHGMPNPYVNPVVDRAPLRRLRRSL